MGSHKAGKLKNAWICVLEGPEDDLLGRNMSSWHVYLCIQNKCCVNWLTYNIYLYIVTLRDEKLQKLLKSSAPIPEEQMRTGRVIFLDEKFVQNCVKFKSDNKGLVCKLNAWFGSSKFVWFDCCIDVSQDSSSIWTMISDISILYCLAALPNKLHLIGPLNSSCVG